MMFKQTSLQEFKDAAVRALQSGRRVVSVIREVIGDFITPIVAHHVLEGDTANETVILESVSHERNQGRYSVVARYPYVKFKVRGGKSAAEISGAHDFEVSDKPLEHLADLLKRFSPEKTRPFFTGGAIGYIGHEAVSLIEPTVSRNPVDDLDLPDILLHFHEQVMVFDHATHALYLIRNVMVSNRKDLKSAYDYAVERLDELEKDLASPSPLMEFRDCRDMKIVSDMTDGQFEQMVLKAKEHIADGDVFQLVLSRRFQTFFPLGDSINLYRLLRRSSPSPFLFHIDLGHIDYTETPIDDDRDRDVWNWVRLVGASPEVMVSIRQGEILVRPLAGTRKRGATEADDAELAANLAADPKEQAEHRMLVDLARNDVGRFCQAGSVKVEGLMRVETYGGVLHMVSDVRGKLKPDVSTFEATLGCMPAGTLCGAPKVRALQLIAELEPCQRGPYGGAVGWFTDTDVEACIMIRAAVITGENLYFQAGAGIVADSIPSNELAEVMAKSDSIRQPLLQLIARQL